MGIRTKLLLPMVLAAIVFLLIVTLYLLPGYEKEERLHHDEIHAATLKGASFLIEPYLAGHDPQAIGEILNNYIEMDNGLVRVEVTDMNGAVVYRTSKQYNPASVHTLDRDVTNNGQRLGTLRLWVDADHYSALDTSHSYGVGFIIGAILFSSLVVTFLVHDAFIRRPIKKLLKSVNALAYGDFDTEIAVVSNDEVGELAASIKMMRNNMAAFQKNLKDKTIKSNDLSESLFESKHRMQSILDNVAHGIVVADERGSIESVNRALCEMTGYSEDELVGSNISMLVPEKYREQHHRGMNRFIETGVSKIIGKGGNELEVLTKSGSIIPVDIAITEMTIAEKRYFNAVLSDVTERTLAELKLKNERDRMQRYLDTVDVIVVALDTQARVKLINRKGVELAGYFESDLLEKSWCEFCVRPQDRGRFNELFEELLHQPDGTIESSESVILSRDNSEKIISWRYSPLFDGDGEVTGLLCTGTDITAAKEAEEEREHMQRQLQQSQKMQAIGQLTGGIAHDFNNIIASILGHAELLMLRLADHKDEKAAKYLENIYRSGERASDLVDKMLAFSRSRGKDVPAAIDVEFAINEIINILRSVLPATIDIKISSAGKGMGVLAAPIDLQQIVMNLCINARDAMNGHGELTIAVNLVSDVSHHSCSSCHQDFSGNYVVIAVTDSGSGIADGQIGRLFEPFYTTKEVGKGTGMGLSVVHGIVHDLGGHITVESTPGKGTSFQVYLKAASTESHDSACADGVRDVVSGDGRLVLIVDDEPLVREFIAELLSESGYGVLLAADPFEALNVVKSKYNEIDVIITDQSMPGMTGVQMARIISSMFSAIPIVLSTGYGADLSETDLQEAGIRFMLTKPMKGQVLLNALAKIFNEHEDKVAGAES